MNALQLVSTLLKIALILGVVLGIGGALTWNDRRMSSMMQDRIGPNRAVFVLPPWLARTLFAAPAFLVAGALAAWAYLSPAPASVAASVRATERILITLELSVLVAWIGLAALTARATRSSPANGFERWLASTVRDPRNVFYAGLAAHVLLIPARYAIAGTPLSASLKPILFTAGPVLLAVVVAASALYAASLVPATGFRLRMAGLMHTAADGLKMIFKEDFVPKNGDRLLHSIAPMFGLFPPLVVLAVVPFGDVLCLAGGKVAGVVPSAGICTDPASSVTMQVLDLDIGILFIFAMSGAGVVGAALAGWASDNKFSLLGGLRAASQMVSYEVTLGLTLVGAFVVYNTLRLDDMVRWQGENAWGIFVQPVAFFLFFAAATAETKRIPFDLPEGESEIVGYFTEYSGMKFGMFFFAEYLEIVTSSALLVTLFLGGWQLPFLHRDGLTIAFGDTVLLHYGMTHLSVTLLQVATFFGKVVLVCLVQAVIRWTLPRFRYDQLMRLGWRTLLPLSIANIVVTAIAVLVVQSSPGAANVLELLGDLTQGVVAAAMIAAVVALVLWALKPVTRAQTVLSSSAELAQAQGGTRATPMQA